MNIEVDHDDAKVICEYYKATNGFKFAIIDVRRLAEIHMPLCELVVDFALKRIFK